jgi:hypothetical protein
MILRNGKFSGKILLKIFHLTSLVGGDKEKKMYLTLFKMKVLTNFAFAPFAKFAC